MAPAPSRGRRAVHSWGRTCGSWCLTASLLAGCGTPPPPPSSPPPPPREPTAVAPAASTDAPLAVYVEPPADHPLRSEILRGKQILEATAASLPANVGNGLRCTSCHLDGGTLPVLGWRGVYGRFPQYRSRSASIQVIEDRINDCFERSLAGAPLVHDSRPMKAIVAYMAWLSRDTPVSGGIAGKSIAQPFESLRPDEARGTRIYDAQCAVCHGPGGAGTAAGTPLWGPRAYTIGAGMARYRTAAAFIRANMPRTAPGSLSLQQALDVAAYIDSKPRPDFAGKERDWPRGGAPNDAPYRTALVPQDSPKGRTHVR